MLKKFKNCLPHHQLVTIYKSIMRPHLGYTDIIYGKRNNVNICNKIKTLQ